MTTTLHRTVQLINTFINLSTTGDATVIAAAAGQVTSCYRLHLTAAGAVTVQVKVGTTVVDSFQFVGTSPAPVVLDVNEDPYYQTAVFQALSMNLSSAVAVTGQIGTLTGA